MVNIDEPENASEEIAQIVEIEPEFSVMGGHLAIIEAPDWAKPNEWLLADSDGNYTPIWPSDVADYIALIEAFGRSTNASMLVTHMDEHPDEGDHNCWDHMVHITISGMTGDVDCTTLRQQLNCQRCGSRYWRIFHADSITDSFNQSWAVQNDTTSEDSSFESSGEGEVSDT